MPSSATVTTRFPFSRPTLSVILLAFACLTALVRPSQPMKKAAASTPRSKRSLGAFTSTGSAVRRASS
jgi:hypothetical protein